MLAVAFQGFGHGCDKLIKAERWRENEGKNGELERNQWSKGKRGRKKGNGDEGGRERKRETEKK